MPMRIYVSPILAVQYIIHPYDGKILHYLNML
jgi:hypothetical protein